MTLQIDISDILDPLIAEVDDLQYPIILEAAVREGVMSLHDAYQRKFGRRTKDTLLTAASDYLRDRGYNLAIHDNPFTGGVLSQPIYYRKRL